MKPEWIALAVNAGSTLFYLWKWDEPGKLLYWLGATILVTGLLLMKG